MTAKAREARGMLLASLILLIFPGLFAFATMVTLDDRPIRPKAAIETEPVPSEGDAADDPAIWIHPKRALRRSTVPRHR